MCTWIEIVRNAIILYYFIGVFHLRENVVMCVPESNETKFSAKIWPFSRDYRLISSRYHLSQQFSQLHFYNFIWQKNGRQRKIVDFLQYLNHWILFSILLLLSFYSSDIIIHFKFWQKTGSEKVGHPLVDH